MITTTFLQVIDGVIISTLGTITVTMITGPGEGGGEMNVIETVSINGANIPPVNKNVPILLKTVGGTSLVGTGDIPITGGEPEFSQTFTKETILFDDGWVKVPHTESLNYKRIIKNYSLEVAYGNGKTLLTPIIAYPSAETYNGTPYQGFFIRDIDNILLQDSDFETVTIKYDVEVEATFDRMNSWRYDSKFAVLGGNVLNDHSAGGASHSGFMSYIFNQIYTGTATVIESVLDALCGFSEIPPKYTPTYAKIKEADLIFRPYAYTAEGEQYGSNANILTIASHGTNNFERINNSFTTGETFFSNVVCVGSRIDDITTLSGTSYGYGLEFFEDQAKTAIDYPEFNPNDWNPFYQQSSTCAIVSAKFRMIKDATGASWNICRLAARLTAKKTVGGQFLAGQAWDMYRGYGIIQVADAIAYIRTNYTESGELISALADKIEFENLKYKDQTIDSLLPNTPLPKRISEVTYSNVDHRHTGETITPDGLLVTKTYSDAEIAALPTNTLFWDTVNNTYAYKIPDGGIIQINQEPHDYYTNLEGGAIVNGDIVSSCGASGNRTAVCLTDATNNAKSMAAFGMCTVATIGNNNVGRITKSGGKVRGLNTNAYTEGTTLFVDPLNKGKWTSTEPIVPNRSVKIGTVIVSHATEGVIELQISTLPLLTELVDGAETTVPSGASFIMKLTSGLWKTIQDSDFYTQLATLFGKLSTINTWALVQTFTSGIKTGKIYPSADSTTAVQVTQADGSTAIVTVDTTNKRVGINSAGAPNRMLTLGGQATTNSNVLDRIACVGTTYCSTSYAATTANGNIGFSFLQGSTLGTQGNGYAVMGIVGTTTDATYGLSTTESGRSSGDFILQTYFSGAFRNMFHVPYGTNIFGFGGSNNILNNNFTYFAANTRTDTINDLRTSNASGVYKVELCTVASATKGGGTWIVISNKLADNTAVASAEYEGVQRYRKSGNNSYFEICMQTGASTYAWIPIIQNNW